MISEITVQLLVILGPECLSAISSLAFTSWWSPSGSWGGPLLFTLEAQAKNQKNYTDNSSSCFDDLQHYNIYLTHHSNINIVCDQNCTLWHNGFDCDWWFSNLEQVWYVCHANCMHSVHCVNSLWSRLLAVDWTLDDECTGSPACRSNGGGRCCKAPWLCDISLHTTIAYTHYTAYLTWPDSDIQIINHCNYHTVVRIKCPFNTVYNHSHSQRVQGIQSVLCPVGCFLILMP